MADRFPLRAMFAALFAALVFVTAAPADTEKKSEAEATKNAAEKRTNKRVERGKLDPALEKSVLAMVETHLPDLKVLLDRLREKEPKQYTVAIRDLARFSRRLQSAKKHGEEAFEIEVEVVKANSAANLLVAKLRVRDDKSDRASLRKVTGQVFDAETARQKRDYAVLLDRLEAMQKQVDTAKKRLAERESQEDSKIEKAYESYLRRAGRKPASK